MMKMRRALSDDEMAPFQTYYIKYPKLFDAEVRKVLDGITQKYATFKYMEFNEMLEKEANKHYQEIKLTKRKKIFAIMSPIAQQENPQSLPLGCKKINITDTPSKNEDEIYISKDSNLQDIQIEMIKELKLDSVWVGLLYRIGTDFEQLSYYLVDYEHFQSFEIGFMKKFHKYLEEKLSKNEAFARQTLDICRRQIGQNVTFFNQNVEEHVRMKFHNRTVIQDIINHPFLNLLCSRSYFNLIYIQGQILNRYNHYKAIAKREFPFIWKNLNLQNFITLDDYIYTEFIFPCLKQVKKFINRTLDREPYKQIVRKYHKDIIRQFRPSFHQYFLSICLVLKERAACLKEAVGSIIVKNKSIISTGYNGTPMGTINCYNGGCKVCNNSEKIGTEVLSCRCIHAEYNCILTAGITQTPGATLYSSKMPCLWCAKLIIQGQIKQVIYLQSAYSLLEYQNVQLVKQTFKAGKVQLIEMTLHFNQ